MIITSCRLRNFRNIDDEIFKLHPFLNVIIGENGQGKTNILEALFLLSTTRSHRVKDEIHCIMHHKDMAKCECTVFDNNNFNVSIVIHQKGKSLFINQKNIQKSSEFIGNLNVILFSSDELTIFNASPKDRRKLIDVEIGKVSSLYMNKLSLYLKLLRDRNALLKLNTIDKVMVDIITNQMIDIQADIIIDRIAFIDAVNQSINHYYQVITNDDNLIRCFLKTCVNSTTKDEIIKELRFNYEKTIERDCFLKMTTIGIHRDDLLFYFNDEPVENIASQGQRRCIILAFKRSLIDIVFDKSGNYPVFLLDDVLSELDEVKQGNFLNNLPSHIQTIITTTDIKQCRNYLDFNPYLLKVNKGKIESYKEVIK